jgi:short-subunit dehydrogenase
MSGPESDASHGAIRSHAEASGVEAASEDEMAQAADYRSRYGEWALVAGASEGLGEAMACDLARRGMKVAMVARGEVKLRAAAERVAAKFGVETRPIPADLGASDVLDVLLNGLDGCEVGFLIYNCAAENGGEFIAQDLERHLANIRVNCMAPTILVHHFAREMAKRGRGGIVICSSLAGVQGLYSWVSYGASKAYEMILGEGLWYELQHHGVGAATLMVGSTYTPNFQRSQQARNAIFAKSRIPEGLPPGAPIPQEPDDASANLFAQLDKEWIPLIYANPADEAAARIQGEFSRAEKIARISDPMRASFKAYEASAGKGS